MQHDPDEPRPTPPPSEAEAYDAAPTQDAEGPDQAAHAVPATPPGEATRCPRCGTENRPGLAFCRNCGQRLIAAGVPATLERPGTPEGTVACPRCGTHNRAGVAFCQNCGASLRAPEPAVEPAAAPPPSAAAAPPAVEPGVEAAVAALYAERGDEAPPSAPVAAPARRAVLGPVVLLIGAVGIVVGWLLPFRYGPQDSLYERTFEAGGYGIAFWNGYPDVAGTLADQAYFGFAAPALILVVLLVALAVGGVLKAAPGRLQLIGLLVALAWAIGLVLAFGLVELSGVTAGDLVGVLREMSPGGIIFFLAGLIVVIGSLTRLARS